MAPFLAAPNTKAGRKEKTSLEVVNAVPEGDYEVPLGPAAVRREGKDVTIIANMLMTQGALAAAAELEREGIRRRWWTALSRTLGFRNHFELDPENQLRAHR